MLRCLGVRITVSGGPIRNLQGVLVVSGHVSWVDIFAIGSVLPGRSSPRRTGQLARPGRLARLMKVIPIDRANLRRLPAVVRRVAGRLRAGQTVVAFPEGTTWCGLGYGQFRPAMFQAAVDAGRPVQPLRLSYHHRDGRPSTVAAFVGDDTLMASHPRLITAQRTICTSRSRRCSCPAPTGAISPHAANPRSAATPARRGARARAGGLTTGSGGSGPAAILERL